MPVSTPAFFVFKRIVARLRTIIFITVILSESEGSIGNKASWRLDASNVQHDNV
jgi:hypothetical protein